jgi:hypothetical protein
MEITLNNKPFDVTIENEKTLDELISGLTDWLNQSGFEITELRTDDQNLELYNDNWKNTLLDKIDKLDITAISIQNKYIADLQTIYQYVTLLQNSIAVENNLLISELVSELPFIINALNLFLNKKEYDNLGLEDLQTLVNELLKDNSDKEILKNNLSQSLNSAAVLLRDRINEVTDPLTEISETAENFQKLIPAIADISVMLQTGDDKKAMDSVLTFIELLEKLIRIFPFLKESGYTDIMEESIENETFNEFYKGMNNILMELIEAFNISDSILIGDLMEYEIAPKINTLLDFLKLIKKVKE